MSYIRVRKHYLHIPYLILGLLEFGLLVVAAYVGSYIATYDNPWSLNLLQRNEAEPAILFAIVTSCCTLSMGVYPALMREGFTSMALRSVAGFCLIGVFFLCLVYLVFPGLSFGRGGLFWLLHLRRVHDPKGCTIAP